MKIKAITLACALLACAGSAGAVDYTVGPVNAGGYFAGDASIGAQTTFNDNWLLSLTGDTSFLGFIFNSDTQGSIGSFSATLSGPNGFSTIWNIESLPGLNAQGGAYEGIGLLAGNYVLHVSGETSVASTYSVAFAAAPVPEPETYAMMLAGLGLIGFMAKRRMV